MLAASQRRWLGFDRAAEFLRGISGACRLLLAAGLGGTTRNDLNRRWIIAFGIALAAGSQACSSSGDASATQGAAASASVKEAARPLPEVTGPVPVGIPVPVDKVTEAVNPQHAAPYAGKVGTVHGRVTYSGDPSPDGDNRVPLMKCPEAAATYGKLFRIGQDKGLADALVAVTGYDGYVPAPATSTPITAHGCALSQRTIAITFGQRIELSNNDPLDAYMPYVDGAAMRAVMVALPHGSPVKLYTYQPGHYLIRDQLPKPYLVADLFVLKYATHDVTGLDGRFKIEHVPVGKAKVDAFLPALGKSVGKEIEVKEGDNEIDLELSFDSANDKLPPRPRDPAHPDAKQPSPKASASAAAPKAGKN
jgi:hypothetical protein